MRICLNDHSAGYYDEKAAFLIVCVLSYFLLFTFSFGVIGHNLMPLVVLITTYTAWLYGRRAGIAGIIAIIAVHAAITQIFYARSIAAIFNSAPILYFGVLAQFLLVFLAQFFKNIYNRLEQTKTELEAAKKQIEEADHAKSVFMAELSHELRNPLSSISGYAYLMREDKTITEKQRERITAIIANTGHMLTLINQILDFSKIESERLEIESIEFDAKSLVAEVCSANRGLAIKKQLFFNEKLTGRFKNFLIGDPFRIKQVLINLISNAIKFTEKGGVEVECGETAIKKGLSRITFKISDTGSGIDEKTMRSLFKPYSQGDASTERKHGGTGLGLAIANRLVKLMDGGRIEVETTPGEGSVFSFSLTLKTGREAEKAIEKNAREIVEREIVKEKHSSSAPPHAADKLKILVAEDNLFNIKLIKTILENRSHEVVEAMDGNSALRSALEHSPDLIFLDIQLPDLNGMEVARKIREAGKTMPIFSITADSSDEATAECIRSGMTGTLSKPFSPEDFYKVTEKYSR